MRADYRTVKHYGESELIIKKSRFLTYVKRAETEEEALDFIQEIKKDASYCDSQLFRLSDW